MKILFICQYFYPETFRGNDIAFHLAAEGHDVHVVTGIPNYPTGHFFNGYGIFKKRNEEINGVRVTRLPIVPRGENSKILLILNYFSFFIVACIWMLLHAIGHRYDRIFCQQLSPVMMSAPAVLYKKIRKVPLYIWVLDLWPESLTAAGGIKNKHILGFFNLFVKIQYKYSDKILMSSNSFRKNILKYGDYANKLIYYPQWADSEECLSSVSDNCFIPNIPKGFIVMFAGAVGEAHGMECNMKAALLTKEFKDIKWVIIGDGRRLDWVKQFIKDNGLEDTVLTLGRYPSHTMPALFAQADVMLVSLTDSPLFNLYAPAKITSYMAAGRPIVAALNGEGGDIVLQAKCGWNIKAGDSEALADLIIKLYHTNKDTLEEKGKNGQLFYNYNFEKNKCLQKLDRIIQ